MFLDVSVVVLFLILFLYSLLFCPAGSIQGAIGQRGPRARIVAHGRTTAVRAAAVLLENKPTT